MKTTTKKAEPKAATATTAKVEAPVSETPAKEEVKKAEAATTKTAAAKKTTTAAKKPAAKKTAAAKKTTTTAKKTTTAAKKTTTTRKKAAPVTNTEVYIQFWGREVYAKDVVERIKEVWANEMGKKPEELLDLKVYIKPEENGAHYVINGDITGFISL